MRKESRKTDRFAQNAFVNARAEKPNRQRLCVVPMIASALVQWAGWLQGMSLRDGECACRDRQNAVAIRVSPVRSEGKSKKGRAATATFWGAAYRCNIFSSSF